MKKASSGAFFLHMSKIITTFAAAKVLTLYIMRKFILLLTVTLLTIPVLGQIKGVVVDDSGTPLMGVVVQDPVSGLTATTDMNGSFQLNVTEGTEIQIALLGFYSSKAKAKPDMQVVLRNKKGSASDEWKMFILANGQTAFPFSPAVGFTIGVVKRFGWYFNAMMGFGFHYRHKSIVDKNMQVHLSEFPYAETPFYSGKRSDQLLSATTGFMARLGGVPLYTYIGAGYGYKSVTYETNNHLWLAKSNGHPENDLSPFHSLCAEVGLMGDIKGFAISAGYEVMLGLGHPMEDVSCAHVIKIGIGGIFDCKRRNQ